jgi:hypothetical protein
VARAELPVSISEGRQGGLHPDGKSLRNAIMTCMKRPKPRRHRKRRPKDEGSYVCPSCGEQIVIPVDPSGGEEQQYVEDCPVCCNPNLIRVEWFGEGEPPRVDAEAE